MVRHPFALIVLIALLGLIVLQPSTATAADSRDDTYKWALGVGGGVVVVDDVAGGDDSEIFFTAAVRIPIGRGHDEGSRGGYGRGGGLRAFIEPEIGIWERSIDFGSDDVEDAEVLNVGVNLLGVISTRQVDYWIGVGFGLYTEDRTIRGGGVGVVASDESTNFGGNLQVGLDVNLGEHVSIFGVGRLDLIDSDFYDQQSKIYGGLRFKF